MSKKKKFQYIKVLELSRRITGDPYKLRKANLLPLIDECNKAVENEVLKFMK